MLNEYKMSYVAGCGEQLREKVVKAHTAADAIVQVETQYRDVAYKCEVRSVEPVEGGVREGQEVYPEGRLGRALAGEQQLCNSQAKRCAHLGCIKTWKPVWKDQDAFTCPDCKRYFKAVYGWNGFRQVREWLNDSMHGTVVLEAWEEGGSPCQ